MAAAASVALVVVVALALTGGPRGARPSPRTSGGATAPAIFPQYFAQSGGNLSGVTIRSARTGALAATAPVPTVRGWSLLPNTVAAAPDSRTFCISYQAYNSGSVQQIWIYSLTVARDGRSASPLTRIKGGTIPGVADLGSGGTMAVSPDGTKLA